MSPRAASRAEVLALRIRAVEEQVKGKDAGASGAIHDLIVDGMKDMLKTMGARFRNSNGAEEMRFSGVVTTCTAGGVQTVNNWLRAARRKLDVLRAREAKIADRRARAGN